jgi:MFS family permease
MAKSSEPKLPIGQLSVLSLCRLAEPIALTSVFPYLPEMIESFGMEKNQVAKWAGITAAAFSVAQAVTGIPWGTASDVLGRKPTLLFGLSMTMVATFLFGFSRSLTWAIVARSLAGASSGTIGITRTAVAEMVPWKELQPRAFSFMPMVWSIGSIVGPTFGGALATPAKKFPDIFGENVFLQTFPFSLPNLIAGIIFFFGVSLGLLYFKVCEQSRSKAALTTCRKPSPLIKTGAIMASSLVSFFFAHSKNQRCESRYMIMRRRRR